MKQYETVVGLEVHVELSTRSKIFCSCPNTFGGEPNTHCCPVCTGMPGTLPVLNRKVLEYAVMTGLATGCEITRFTKFDRKNYFYPDLPKAYQISQLYLPICRKGYIEIELQNGESKRIGIHEIHMEEDAGKLLHDPWEDCTLVDYNRCGVPLLEIVSSPDLRSAEEAILYLNKLRSILQFLGVSDCKMQEGSFRADVNLSVRPVGENELGTRTEMKNMNSLKAIARAIEKESLRQIELIEDGGKVKQQTRRWDENKDASFAMRSKENAQDYRYFPEPDLLPCIISQDFIDGLAGALPELPDKKIQRYSSEYLLPLHDILILTSNVRLSSLLEESVACGIKPKEASNWIMGDLLKAMKDADQLPEDSLIDPHAFAALIMLASDGRIGRPAAKRILAEMLLAPVDPAVYAAEHNLFIVNDEAAARMVVAEVLASSRQSVDDFRNGKEKAFSYLMGQVMRNLKGKADPTIVTMLIKEELSKFS
ncbi:MAG: Asp-tRNA(Asn)/Glu-tRNA(Gln) amidotransferase subunit GatB [Saccharofermentanales bacterium]